MSRLFYFSSLILSIAALSCPPGYTDGQDGSCYGGPYFTIDRNSAYYYCSQHNAYLYDITNAFQNSDVMKRAGKNLFIWTGLTCLNNQTTSCQWDNTGISLTNGSYTNFANGGMNPSAGACVALEVKTGLWYSLDCSNDQAVYGCKYTPGVTVPKCAPSGSKTATFRGNCYFPLNVASFTDGASSCGKYCGTITSIHSLGENSFVRNLAGYLNPNASYMFTGLKYTTAYSWQDASPVDYSNFGYNNTAIGPCVSMALMDGFVKDGQWINSQCDGNLVAVCQKPLNNVCDATTTTPTTTLAATMAPVTCGDPAVYNGQGTLYSPGYPYSSIPNHCEYLITEDSNQVAGISFNDGAVDYDSFIALYSDMFSDTPYRTIRGQSLKGIYSRSTTNILRVVYNTTGSTPHNNFWSAGYSGY